MHNARSFIKNLLFFTILFALSGIFCSRAVFAQTINLDPVSQDVDKDTNFSLDVDVSDVTDLYNVSFYLNYDASLVEFVNATEGNFLSEGGIAMTVFMAQESEPGKLIVGYNRLVMPVSGVSGSGNLMTLNFKTLSQPGDADFIFSDNVLYSSAMETIVTAWETATVSILDDQQETVVVNLTPVTQEINESENFSLDVNIADITDMFGTAFYLNFDPTLINFESGVEGDFLSNQGLYPTLFDAQEDQGELIVALSCLNPMFAGVSGSGKLMTLNFTSNQATGTTELIFSNAEIQDTSFTIITAEWQPASVTISEGGDQTLPVGTVVINNNDEYASSTDITLSLSATDASGVDEMKISNIDDFDGTSAESYVDTKQWVLEAGDGEKTVYAWFKDTKGNWSGVFIDTIILDAADPVISGVGVSELGKTSAKINWQTNEETYGSLEYGKTEDFGNIAEDDGNLKTNHTFSLSNLSQDTKYYYRITSQDAVGNIASSTGTFITEKDSGGGGGGGGAVVTGGGGGYYVKVSPLSKPFNVRINVSGNDVILVWKNPNHKEFKGILIVRKAHKAPYSRYDGEIVYRGDAEKYRDAGIDKSITYYYAVSSFDKNYNYTDSVVVNSSIKKVVSPKIPIVKNEPDDKDKAILKKEAYSAQQKWQDGSLLVYEKAVYVVANGKRRGIVSAKVFKDLGYKWANLIKVTKQELESYPMGKFIFFFFFHTSGTLVKIGNAIYKIENGKLRKIKSPGMFAVNGFKWSNVVIATEEDSNLPMGEAISFPNGTLLKGSKSTVYLVENGKKRMFVNAKSFLERNYAWKNIIHVADIEFSNIEKGENIYSGSLTLNVAHPEGKLIKISDSIYLIKDGKLRKISSPQMFKANGFNWFDVVLANENDLVLPIGDTLGFPEGTMVKGEKATIYLIEGGKKRPFSNAKVFLQRGYNWENVLKIPNPEILNIQTGEVIK